MDFDEFRYQLTLHARKAIRERRIKLEWIDRVLSSPQKVLKDKDDPQLEHALGTIQEYGNRILRVIYNKKTNPYIIVTVYFDRKLKGML